MADVKNALKSVIVWLHDIFTVAEHQLNDVEAKKEILLALGLDPVRANTPVQLPPDALASIKQYIDKSDDDIDIESFASVVADIISVSNAIDDFIHIVTADEDPEIAGEFMDLILQLYLIEAVRLRSTGAEATKDAKRFNLICKSLNLFQEIASPSGGISNFTGNIVSVLVRLWESRNAENEAEAALVSDAVGILLAGLGFFIPFFRDSLKAVYGYDGPPNSLTPHADRIAQRTISLSIAKKFEDPQGNEIRPNMLLAVALRPKDQRGVEFENLLAGGGKFTGTLGDSKFSFAMDGVQDVDLRTTIRIEHIGGHLDIEAKIPDRPEVSAKVLLLDVGSSFSLPAGLTGSKVTVEKAATNAAKFTLRKNGVEIGSVDFAAGAKVATFVFNTKTDFVAGDLLEMIAPSLQDATLADINIVLVASAFGVEQLPLVIGDSKGTNLTIGKISFQLTASVADNDLDLKISTRDSAFALVKGKTDGFLNSILPDNGIYGSFDLGVGYSLQKGVYVDGGSGLTVLIPLHTTLGPVVLNSFYLKLAGNEAKDGVLVETSIGFSTKFLGFAASVERIGLLHNFSLPADVKKNLGFVNYNIGFKPPNGVGLSLDAGVLKGGGFLYFDPDKGEYFGALELTFKELFAIKAIGVINTKMPDGSPGFSMLVIITAEFQPIQLGFGFTLSGVGGLLGLNRTVRIDVLREGIKTNALASILFPQDVVANMSRILSDMRQVFPPLNDKFLVSPMGKLGWGTPTILSLEIGLLLEIPIPRVAILGILKALLPTQDEALLRLQVDFLGIIDFDNKYISFDASLYDSRLLVYTLSGDMAFRLSWGESPMFILSVGGFHPAFRDAPGDLQNMTRLTLSLLSGDNPRITLQSYFAITSNTVQFGAKAELYAAASGFNVYGFIGFDLLFQFDPFKFIATFTAGLTLRRGSSVIMGIRVSGELSGPTPWDAKGEASISILFFDISVSFHETWGDRPGAVETETEDLLQRLTAEVSDNRNWKADIPNINNLHVSVKKIEAPADKLVVHPFGILTFSERLVPLEISIDKFGNKAPKDARRFEIKPTDSGVITQPVTEHFAPANFFAMKDSDKLSRPSFERMKSGFRITGSSTLVLPTAVNKSVDYELTYLRKRRGLRIFAGAYRYMKTLFQVNLRASAVAGSALSVTRQRVSVNAPDLVAVKDDGYAVANSSDLKIHQDGLGASSYTEAQQILDRLVRQQPSLKGKVQVVAEYELDRG